MQWKRATSIPTRCGSSTSGSRRRGDAGIEVPESMALATVDARRPAVRADGAAERSGRAGLRLLHEPGEPQRRRAGGEPARGPPLPLAATRPPGARRRPRRADLGRGVGGLLRHAAASEPNRRLGVAPEPAAHRSRRARAPLRRGRSPLPRRTACRCRRTGAATASSRTRTSSGSTARTGCTTGSATSGTETSGKRSGSRPVALEESPGRLVRGRIVGLPEQLHQAAEHVADADHPEQVLTITVDDGKMADLLLAHQPGGIEHGGADVDRERRPSHHVTDANGVEVGAVARKREDVALREDADEPPGIANRDGPDALLEHAQDGQPSRVVSVDRDHSRPHDVADRHCGDRNKGSQAGASAPGV